MIGVIFCIITLVLGVVSIVFTCKAKESKDFKEWFCIAMCFLSMGIMVTSISYFRNMVYYPEEYIRYKNSIEKVKAIIDKEQFLNLKDNQMGIKLSGLIIEFERIKRNIRIAKTSPFTIYKPIINMD